MVLTGLQDQEDNPTYTELPMYWLWAICACSVLPLVRSAGCSFVALLGPAGAAPWGQSDRPGGVITLVVAGSTVLVRAMKKQLAE